MPYQHPSGSQKRQKKDELAEKEKETIRKVPRITSFFHKEPSTSAEGSQADADVEVDQPTSLSAAISEAENEVEGDKISSLAVDEEESRTLDESTPTTEPGDAVGHPTDIRLWPSAVSGEMLQFWVEREALIVKTSRTPIQHHGSNIQTRYASSQNLTSPSIMSRCKRRWIATGFAILTRVIRYSAFIAICSPKSVTVHLCEDLTTGRMLRGAFLRMRSPVFTC